MKGLIRSLLLGFLSVKPLRPRVVFHLKRMYYPDLDLQAPLSHGMVCPVISPEYWYSFSEIFLCREYAPALDQMPLPEKWLDFGCHAGFFSLWLAWQRRQKGLSPGEALLADADGRVGPAIERLNKLNPVTFKFLHGALAARKGEVEFVERSFMASSLAQVDARDGRLRRVPVLTETEIMDGCRPPYDLIKLDIEGGEFDFLRAYPGLLRNALHLIVEWHGFHGDSQARQRFLDNAAAAGFSLTAEIMPPKLFAEAGVHVGTVLLSRTTVSESVRARQVIGAE